MSVHVELPKKPCAFVSRRKGSNNWASQPSIVKAWREADLCGVTPLTLEMAVSQACNLGCRECPYRDARRALGVRRLRPGEFAVPNDKVCMNLETAKVVIDKAKEAGVTGVLQTGGGSPLTHPQFVEILHYSHQRRLPSGLYTNGIQVGFDSHLADELLAPDTGLLFVRESINAVRPNKAARFSGARPGDVGLQLEGLQNLLHAREKHAASYGALGQRLPAVQISVICDESNVEELPLLSRTVADIYRRSAAGGGRAGDFLLVRPLTKHCRSSYSTRDHKQCVIDGILRHLGRNGESRQMLKSAGVSVALGFGLDLLDDGKARDYASVVEAQYKKREICWANGLFLTVGPDAGVHLCCDRNCYPDWAVGNLKTQTVAEVYRSLRRHRLLQCVHAARCGPSVCEPFCRAVRLNRIAAAIHQGELSDLDIALIRQHAKEGALLLG